MGFVPKHFQKAQALGSLNPEVNSGGVSNKNYLLEAVGKWIKMLAKLDQPELSFMEIL